MAIAISQAKLGMFVQTLSKDVSSLNVNAYKDSSKKKLLHRYPNGINVGKITKIDTVNNTVQVRLSSPLRERMIIKHNFAYLDADNLLVVPIKTVLPTNVAELQEMYVVKGKTNVLVRRSPVLGVAFARVQGNQMVRATGRVKQGFTEVVTDNGNGWISTQFLTTTKPATVIVSQPPVQQESQPNTTPEPATPGVIYVPVEKPVDLKKNVITLGLVALGAFIVVKFFKKNPKPL